MKKISGHKRLTIVPLTKLLNIFLYVYASTFTFSVDSVYAIALNSFFVLTTLILIDFLSTKTISLYQVWIFAFVFIILAEALVSLQPSANISLRAVRYLIFTNFILLFGYSVTEFPRLKRNRLSNTVLATGRTLPLLLLVTACYTIYQFPKNFIVFSLGRTSITEGDVSLASNIIGALGYLLPSILAYYFKFHTRNAKLIWPLLASVPIFVTLFVGGTRFPLLFSFLGFVLVWFDIRWLNSRKITQIVCASFFLFYAAGEMRQFRAFGVGSEAKSVRASSLNDDSGTIFTRLAQNMSPEGVIDMTNLLMRYFDSHDHLCGRSSSFILYFWVPRSIWDDKPSMLGHWLVRKFRSGFSDGFSSSFGFTGDLYADFGYYSLFFVLILGVGLKRLEALKDQYFLFGGYRRILGAMFFPYVFFFVRSPITATMTFIGIYFFYVCIRALVFRQARNFTLVEQIISKEKMTAYYDK